MPLAEETTTGGPAKLRAVEPLSPAASISARASRLRAIPAAAAAPTPTNVRLEIGTGISPVGMWEHHDIALLPADDKTKIQLLPAARLSPIANRCKRSDKSE